MKVRIVSSKEVASHPRLSLSPSDYIGRYVCMICGSNDVDRTDGIDERYPDDWLLECKNCGNWEHVGNGRPSMFKVVK